jgi:hypothetical protein
MNHEEGSSSRRLRADVAWAHALLGLDGITITRPELHHLLFSACLRLSESCGSLSRARRLRSVAYWHYARSGQFVDTRAPNASGSA